MISSYVLGLPRFLFTVGGMPNHSSLLFEMVAHLRKVSL